MENESKTIVSSWNEWDPLKHVIVGRAEVMIEIIASLLERFLVSEVLTHVNFY